MLDAGDRAAPVVYAAELPELRGLDDETLRAVLGTKRIFGTGTTVVAGSAPAGGFEATP